MKDFFKKILGINKVVSSIEKLTSQIKKSSEVETVKTVYITNQEDVLISQIKHLADVFNNINPLESIYKENEPILFTRNSGVVLVHGTYYYSTMHGVGKKENQYFLLLNQEDEDVRTKLRFFYTADFSGYYNYIEENNLDKVQKGVVLDNNMIERLEKKGEFSIKNIGEI